MSYISNLDFLIEVQKGNVPGHSLVHKFGRNDGVPNGGWEVVTSLSALTGIFHRSSASTVRIKAGGDAADTTAGAGAQEVTVQGIVSGTFAEETEVIATAGVSASASTSKSFWRVHRAWVSGAGTYGNNNTANIVIEDSGGVADIIQIEADAGQSEYTGFTIPSGKTGYLLSIHRTVDSNKAADFRLFTRANIDDTAAPVSARRIRWRDVGLVAGAPPIAPRSPNLVLAEKTDIWMEALGNGGTASVTSDFELLLVDD